MNKTDDLTKNTCEKSISSANTSEYTEHGPLTVNEKIAEDGDRKRCCFL